MSGLKVERPRHLDLNPKRVSFEDPIGGRHSPTFTPSPKKIKLDPEFRQRRRRTHSCSFLGDRKRRQSIIIPTKFLLGGNITDPLNLEALGQEDESKKVSEPVHRGGEAVKVIIPPNINDPLNLDACSEDGEEQLADAISRQRRRRKFRKRKRRNSEPTSGAAQTKEDRKMSASVEEDLCKIGAQLSPKPESADVRPACALRQISCPAAVDRNKNTQPCTTAGHAGKQSNAKRWRPKCDRIVSPVIKQPGVKAWHYGSTHPPDKPVCSPKSYHPKNALYQYGNYNQYYGYRNPNNVMDPRLKYFKRTWFESKDVLDIGCNIGHISLLVARDFFARKVIGIDIDRKLIAVANKNYKHYLPSIDNEQDRFPKSMKTLYGSLKPTINKEGSFFPHNVKFYQNNYVLEAPELLETIKEEFDCILCLSVTKWVHLNFGDDGLKRFFDRIYRNLRSDGLLILEPQAWPSYKKKRKLTPEIFETYKSIEFFPNQFEAYLTKTLGFFHIHTFRVDHTLSKGFHRMLCVFRKPTEAEKKASKVGTCTLDGSSQTGEFCSSGPQPDAADGKNVPNVTDAVAGPSAASSESTCSKSSLVQSTACLAASDGARSPLGCELPACDVNIGAADEGLLTNAPDEANNNNNVAAATEDESNSPTVGSTTDNLARTPTPTLETSTCDSTTDEVDPNPGSPSPSDNPAGEKS